MHLVMKVTIQVSDKVFELFKKLCDLELRSQSKEVEFLILERVRELNLN